MATYTIGGRSAATAATANIPYAELWNPHSTKRITVREIWIANTVATIMNTGVLRSSARGTAGSTVTPGTGSGRLDLTAPQSGALLDLASFSVAPTYIGAADYLGRWNLPAAIGAGIIHVFSPGVEVGPGAGLCVVTPVAVIGQPSDITFVWEE